MHIKKITGLLEVWVQEKIISPDQKDQILLFEKSRSGDKKSRWALYGFLILGITVISIGIVSLIAANWEVIPGSVKLTLNFALLAGIAAVIIQADIKNKNIAYEILAAFFSLLCLASIGLISQVFHTGGEPYQALFFWLVIIFPLSFLSKKNFLPHLWVVGFLTTLIAWSFSDSSWWKYISTSSFHDEDVIFILFLIIPLICFSLYSFLKRTGILYKHAMSLGMWTILSAIAACITTDIYLSKAHFEFERAAFIPVIIFSVSALAAVISDTSSSTKEKMTITVIIIFTLLVYLPQIITDEFYFDTWDELAGALYAIIILILLTIFFVIRENKALFNAATLLLGIRFLVVYFQVMENLAYTGLGLIISGLIIIGISLLWFKKRTTLQKWLGEKIHD